jgi:hypothetical protein
MFDKYPMLYIQFTAADDGRRYRLKHVKHFTEINNLCYVASCWLYLEIHTTLIKHAREKWVIAEFCPILVFKLVLFQRNWCKYFGITDNVVSICLSLHFHPCVNMVSVLYCAFQTAIFLTIPYDCNMNTECLKLFISKLQTPNYSLKIFSFNVAVRRLFWICRW